jgi:hypothetical protein
VRVVGYCYQAPFLEFLSKGEHFSSITGEKISEFQVVEAGKAAARVSGFDLENFRLGPFWDETPYYGVLLEENNLPEARLLRFAHELDENLCRLNIEYLEKRRSGRLGPVRVKTIPAGTFEQEKVRLITERGVIAEQYKHTFLSKKIYQDGTLNIQREVAPEPGSTKDELNLARRRPRSQAQR